MAEDRVTDPNLKQQLIHGNSRGSSILERMLKKMEDESTTKEKSSINNLNEEELTFLEQFQRDVLINSLLTNKEQILLLLVNGNSKIQRTLLKIFSQLKYWIDEDFYTPIKLLLFSEDKEVRYFALQLTVKYQIPLTEIEQNRLLNSLLELQVSTTEECSDFSYSCLLTRAIPEKAIPFFLKSVAKQLNVLLVIYCFMNLPVSAVSTLLRCFHQSVKGNMMIDVMNHQLPRNAYLDFSIYINQLALYETYHRLENGYIQLSANETDRILDFFEEEQNFHPLTLKILTFMDVTQSRIVNFLTSLILTERDPDVRLVAMGYLRKGIHFESDKRTS